MTRNLNKSIVHMFLPKMTPDKREDDLEQIEEDMLIYVTESFKKALISNTFLRLTPVQVMLDKWVNVQPKSSADHKGMVDLLISELEGLQIGNTIPIYIRHQNVTMMISKFEIDGKEKVKIQTFRASLPSQIIMSNVHSLKMSFPETSNIIENESMLCSKIFASHLIELATEEFELAMGTTEKGGSSYAQTRDVPQPFLVSEWAVGVLVPREDPTKMSISKKVRDHVTMATQNSRSLSPFRRSGMWMSIKVVLQLKILELLGGDEDTAKVVYKIVMLRILVDACKSYDEEQENNFHLDLASQMIAKVGKRVWKLKKLLCSGDCNDLISKDVELMRSTVLEYTLDAVTKLRGKIQNLWNQVTLHSEETNNFLPIKRSVEEFKAYLVHIIDPLDKAVKGGQQLLKLMNQKPNEESDIEDIKKRSLSLMEKHKKQRFSTMPAIKSHSITSDTDQHQLKIWLYDTEQYIKSIKGDDYSYTSKEIFDMGQGYITQARQVYKDNPLGFSQLILVSLKLLRILDEITTRKHPLVLEYNPNIPSTFDYLLLPYQQDLDLLNELIRYFYRRYANSFRSILERKVDPKSLSVRYAEGNADMARLKAQIKQKMNENIQEKTKEVKRIREECRDLQKQMKKLGGSCSCRYEMKKIRYWNPWEGKYQTESKQKKVYSCDYCPLESTLNDKRKSVTIYEAPLPPQDHFQNAVVFELLIPEEISHLRQFLAIMKYELLGETVFKAGKNNVSTEWLEYKGLEAYTSKTTNMISLGSTIMPSSSTHHSNTNPDLLSSGNDSFIVNNGMNCHYHYEKHREPVRDVKDECTFHLKKTANSGPYESLQKFLSSTEHSQNDVIANQNECDQKLCLDEYITFGSLRAGHRLQLRNLYRAISNRSLSLEKEPVLALVLQTIWQVGPRSTGGVREVHFDFQLDDFALEFLELLENLVQSKTSNYSTPLVLLVAIFITGRIMELNTNHFCRWKCYQLFKEWRSLAETWCTKIENDLKENSNMKCEANKAKMQKVLHEIKMCSMMTYNICCIDQMSDTWKGYADIAHLLRTISSKNQLVKESNPSISGFMEILKFVEQMIPVRLNLDRRLTSGKELLDPRALPLFFAEKFPIVRDYSNFTASKASDNNIIMAQYSNDHCITLDVFGGELLINGYPETELSTEISENAEFKRFFQKRLKFRVQRLSRNVLRTSDPFHGKNYEFKCQEMSQLSQFRVIYKKGRYRYNFAKNIDLDIIEIQETHPNLILVPHQKFRGFISDNFIDNYTHWLDPINAIMYFRRIAMNDNDYDMPHEYVLARSGFGRGEDCINGWLLHDEINDKYLLSIKSDGFMLITGALEKLELAKHINVLISTDNNGHVTDIKAHLPRHNLQFKLQPDGLLESTEYPGFHVSINQNSAGTFIGLRNGILLENGATRSIIIPHGKIMTSIGSGSHHHVSEIDLEKLSQPSFFSYEFDDVLKRLVARKSISSWLYLGALHAVTSSTQTDPFTGMTGTEMAVNILQSALVWSCSPYDKESLEILKFIKGLSPKRNYYGHAMSGDWISEKKQVKEVIETIEWPKEIPPMTAFDGYAILVDHLVRDSVRLQSLHPIKDNCKDLYEELMENHFSEKLLMRAYLRNLGMYNEEVKLNEEIVKHLESKFEKNEGQLIWKAEKEDLALSPMLTTAYVHHLCDSLSDTSVFFSAMRGFQLQKNTLTPFLFTDEPLLPLTESKIGMSLKNLLVMEFRTCWLEYYYFAVANSDAHEFGILMSALAYRGEPKEQISTLQCIRFMKAHDFTKEYKFPRIPELPNAVDDPTDCEYDSSEIVKILKEHSSCFPKSPPDSSDSEYDDDYEKYITAEKAYNDKVQEHCDRIAKQWKETLWPCREISNAKLCRDLRGTNIKTSVLNDVNTKIQTWFHARQLKIFIDELQDVLDAYANKFSTHELIEMAIFNSPVLNKSCPDLTAQKCQTPSISLNDLMEQSECASNLSREVRKIYKTGRFEESNEHEIRSSKHACELKIQEIEDTILQTTSKTIELQIIRKSGLSPRLSPLNLLKILQNPTDHDRLVPYAGTLGVLWTLLKKFNRCLRLQRHGQEADLKKELQNTGHESWSPMKRPEWLLIELELDITIRNVQVQVAEQMRKMPDEKNGVMQLNMGEGKTSVIVPMLCSILAKDDSLCRVTVLSSIFKMNWDILKFAIGGLLNRRLYSFPCRRNNMQIDHDCINVIQDTYKECMEMKGVVLTLPEHRLSFRLLAYDKIHRGELSLGLKLLETEDWLRWHVRDILDESDELLSVKYQLVYTIGEQIPVDGGDIRWLVCQDILGIVQEIAPQLLDTYGSTLIEFNRKTNTRHEFSTVRLLAAKENEPFFEEFEKLVVDEYLASVTLTESQKKDVTEFLLMKKITPKQHDQVITLHCTFLKEEPVLLEKILTLAGYIRRGVLRLALTKRWRVEYGVDKKGFRKMAVPFRAKDVAAERTEFGHPDLAIILTHLSYYYSGLCDTELEEVFSILAKKLNSISDAIYSKWIDQIRPRKLVRADLKKYSSINLRDAFQKADLFHLIRRHKAVVDFWLSQTVFLNESKQFPGKLVMTATDLVYERQRLPITGFSGTNDSIVLLPLTTSQQDLPLLKGTNERMEEILEQPENSGHRGLMAGVTCDDILHQMKEDKLRILIDSGALMLELDNGQVAERWLEIDSGIEAVVYFNKDNELMVKLRRSDSELIKVDKQKSRGRSNRRPVRRQPTSAPKLADVPFELSPFQGKLECCGVFLDDQHTRGTDLKFPSDSKACVTIGSGMKREKLLQACMRMRKLGKGHSVAFYLSHDAASKVAGNEGAELTTTSVLDWVKRNTKEFNEDGLLHWAIATKNYAQRLAAEDIFHYPNFEDPIKMEHYVSKKAQVLAQQCVDKEVTALMDMYGQRCRIDFMTNVITNWFDVSYQKLHKNDPPPPEIISRFKEISSAVRRRCEKHVPEKRILSSSTLMDEVQEKVLEFEKEAEVEEERQVERSGKCIPAKSRMHPNVTRMLAGGGPFEVMDGIKRLSDIFEQTGFSDQVQADCWSVEVYATDDFISVIIPSSLAYHKAESYLRPIEYLVSNRRPNERVQLLLLSPYEANELLPQIRSHGTKTKCWLHMFVPRRLKGQNILLNMPRLQLPPASTEPGPGRKEFQIFKSGSREMAALLVASGSLYFNEDIEQKSYASFLSLVPKPWNDENQRLFDSDMIRPSGFLVPKYRQEHLVEPLGFQDDPVGLVRKILRCRHSVVSDISHVVQLLEKNTYGSLGDGEEQEGGDEEWDEKEEGDDEEGEKWDEGDEGNDEEE